MIGIKQVKSWSFYGAVAGVVSVVLMWILNFFPKISVTFSTYAVDLTKEGTISKAVGEKILQIIGVSTGNLLTTLIAFAISGAIIFVVGRAIYEYLPLGTKSKQAKIFLTMLYGSIIASLVIAGFGELTVKTLISLVIYALVLSWVLIKISQNKKIKLPVPD